MYIFHVFAHIKPDCLEDFKIASIENARNSLKEPGIARFDVIQQKNDPTWFVLVEVYRNAKDPAEHKKTAHYHKCRGAVEPMMAEPRKSIQFRNIFPDEKGWDTEPVKDEI